MSDLTPRSRRGSGVGMHAQESARNTGGPRRCGVVSSARASVATGNPRGTGRAVGESERFIVPTKPAKVGPPGRGARRIAHHEAGREGTSVQGQRPTWRGPGDWR